MKRKKRSLRDFFDGLFAIFFGELARSFPARSVELINAGFWFSSFFSPEKRAILKYREKYRNIFPEEFMDFHRFIGNNGNNSHSKKKTGKDFVGLMNEEQRFLFTVWKIANEAYLALSRQVEFGVVEYSVCAEQMSKFGLVSEVSKRLMRHSIDETFETWGDPYMTIIDGQEIAKVAPPSQAGCPYRASLSNTDLSQMLQEGFAKFARF